MRRWRDIAAGRAAAKESQQERSTGQPPLPQAQGSPRQSTSAEMKRGYDVHVGAVGMPNAAQVAAPCGHDCDDEA